MNTEPENTTQENEGLDDVLAGVDGAADQIPATDQAFEDGDEVGQLKHQLADAEKRVLMAHADLENFRRRTRRDTQDQLKYSSLRLMSEILDSVDNLNRAVESHQEEATSEGLLDGVKMVAGQISTILENHGCKKIEALGQPFDPNLHQAVQMQPSDEYESDIVMLELRAGYQLHDRVVRPTQVFVSTGPA